MKKIMRKMGWGVMAGLLLGAQLAGAVTWDGGGSDLNWGTAPNWSDGAIPAGKNLVFNNIASTGVIGAVNSIIDQNFTIGSLLFTNTGEGYHTVQIPDGVTLTVTGAVIGADNTNIVDVGETVLNTTMGVTGAGTLTLTNPLAAFQVRADYAASTYHSATMDASGLSTLNAYVKSLRLAYGSVKKGYLMLAATNTIVTEELSVGGYFQDAQCDAILQMGYSNALQIGTLYVARGRSTTATMKFRNGGTNCAATVRGAAGGSSRCAVYLGYTGWNSTAANGVLDFGAGSVDALFSTVLIGVGCDYPGSATGYGTLTLNAGTVDCSSIELGRGVSGPGYGVINLGGGLLKAVTFRLGNQSSTATINTGLINLSGGVLQAVTITNGVGEGTRRLNWAGGTIQNYPGNNMNVAASVPIVLSSNLIHTFNVESGKVMTIAGTISHAGGGASGILKTNEGTLMFGGANTFTGMMTVVGGTLGGRSSVGGGLSMGAGTRLLPGAVDGTGAFNVTGDFSLGGVLHVDVDGYAATNDSILAGGNVTLISGCTLEVAFTGNPAPTSTIVRYVGSLSGTFDSIPAGWAVDYGSGNNDAVRLIRTAAVDSPVIENRAPTDILATSASMNGYLVNTGNSPAYVMLYWGTNDGGAVAASWQHSNSFVGAQTMGALTTNITGLTPGTVQYYRYYATNDMFGSWAPSTRIFGTAGGGLSLLWENAAGGADQTWSNLLNWSPDASPQANNLTFNNTAATNGVGCINSRVDQDYTVGSLLFANSGANYHTLGIADEVTLTVTGAVSVGGLSGLDLVTTVNMTNGALVINSPGTNLSVCQNYSVEGASSHRATLDLRGLSSLSANLYGLDVGVGSSLTRGTVYLPNAATVSVSRIIIAQDVGAGYQLNESFLYFGQDGVLNVDSAYIGRHHALRGYVYFAPGLTNPRLVIRNKAGTGRVGVWKIGVQDVAGTDVSGYGTVNFNGGIIDAQVSTMVVGERSVDGGGGVGVGYLYFDGGQMDVSSLILGRSTANLGNSYGYVTLGGTGTLRVVTLTMGQKTGTSTFDPIASVSLNGGTLQAVTITGTGAATRRINWAGGTIQNYPDSNMTVAASITTVLSNNLPHILDVPTNLLMTLNGVISNVAAGASGIVKTNAGTVLLNAVNVYTGETIVAAGTMGGTGAVSGILAVLGGGTVAPGITNSIGTFTVVSNVMIDGSCVAQIDNVSAASTNDVLVIGGNLTLGAGSKLAVTMIGVNRQPRYPVIRYAGSLTGRFGTSELPAGFAVYYSTANNSAIEVGPLVGTLLIVR